MAAIDLSKAKVGDKFRTRYGQIMKYVGEDQDRCIGNDKFIFKDEEGNRYHFYENGNYMYPEEHKIDLIEQVFDETLDTIERDERRNSEMKEVVEEIEEDQELQRRQYVVELAERIFFSDRGNIYSFKECVEIAEYSVSIRNQYLNEGKLC
jgi:hypothetical protein